MANVFKRHKHEDKIKALFSILETILISRCTVASMFFIVLYIRIGSFSILHNVMQIDAKQVLFLNSECTI